MSNKKFLLPKISLPKLERELASKCLLSGAFLAAITVSCALLLSGTNTLLSALVREENTASVTDLSESDLANTDIPSSQEEVSVK